MEPSLECSIHFGAHHTLEHVPKHHWMQQDGDVKYIDNIIDNPLKRDQNPKLPGAYALPEDQCNHNPKQRHVQGTWPSMYFGYLKGLKSHFSRANVMKGLTRAASPGHCKPLAELIRIIASDTHILLKIDSVDQFLHTVDALLPEDLLDQTILTIDF
ncbi:hypothetical protein ACLOJK_013478 [Asimina triloba]